MQKKQRLKKVSILAIIIIALTCVQFRALYSDISGKRELQVTSWDALGYYFYLPAIFIYEDYTKCEWFPEIDEKYQVSGGWVYQLSDVDNGNKVGKYLGGVAIIEAPFFFIGHAIALNMDEYPADGFSAPYQYAISFGCIFWFIIGLLILRRVLLCFFDERTTAVTLILLVLGTNALQYSSVDNAMSHGFIFPLYSMLLFATIKWHYKPQKIWAFFIGLVIGLACISRPTELIMILIPILWFTHTKAASKKKWELVFAHKNQILFLALGGILGVAPQLIYWKQVTGSWVYDVGSKWDFLTPHFQVLFGFTKGMFIYTPLTILFIVGMFMKKKMPFRKSVIWFGLLNIYIIIAWHHWRYGASYANRAIMQSMPLYALPMAMVVAYLLSLRRWAWFTGIAMVYFVGVNIFQTWQYNETILHYDDNNRKYYAAIYLDANPTPLDMSLLDTDEILRRAGEAQNFIVQSSEQVSLDVNANDSLVLIDTIITSNSSVKDDDWFKVSLKHKIEEGAWNNEIKARIITMESLNEKSFRIWTPIYKKEESNENEFFIKVPDRSKHYRLLVTLHPKDKMIGQLEEFRIAYYVN